MANGNKLTINIKSDVRSKQTFFYLLTRSLSYPNDNRTFVMLFYAFIITL